MDHKNTVLVSTQISTNDETKFHCFLTDRMHDFALDEIEGKEPMEIMDMETKKRGFYEKIVELNLQTTHPNAESFWIMSVVCFANEKSLDMFILQDQVGILNKMNHGN